MKGIKGRRFIVTGAHGALGSAVVSAVGGFGGEAFCLDVTPGSNGDCQVDLTNWAETKACIASLGEIDGVFNIAGGFAMGATVWDESDEQWEKMFALNVSTLRNVVRAVVPALLQKRRGSIVNVGAAAAASGVARMGSYCASKSVVMRLTESLSAELKDKGINVNGVLPSIIDTPQNRESMPGADFFQWVKVDDLARIMCFLASDAAKPIHGALIPVCGQV
jgi:NAD(P)-dependent dehydrogenase (short-subunit alcohol dehydrogenase family)